MSVPHLAWRRNSRLGNADRAVTLSGKGLRQENKEMTQTPAPLPAAAGGPVPAEPIYAPSTKSEPLRQTEVLSNVIETRQSLASFQGKGEPEIERTKHPYALVVSQDCDLEQDFLARFSGGAGVPPERLLPNVLLCVVVTVEELHARTPKGSDIWKRVVGNKDERYHFLQKVDPSEDALGEGLPAMGIDFKRCFTVPTDELYSQLGTDVKRRCRMVSPYLEHFASRFAYFLSRVALPRPHAAE